MKEFKTVTCQELELKTCSFMDEIYGSGDEFCQADRCVICRDGMWEEKRIV